ncbi:hypothetical protein JOB18_018268 [Solea senegalensis]|uniref:Uncharacterized protein n=1 Tax=Solea senegalensis TaxID=28829 RepID=A0AAV6SSD7_SOLSE|nr:hypothetical protein JOB18_018268 [Solea senegalensis]
MSMFAHMCCDSHDRCQVFKAPDKRTSGVQLVKWLAGQPLLKRRLLTAGCVNRYNRRETVISGK